MHHALALSAALTSTPIAAILVAVPLDTRIEDMVRRMRDAIDHVSDHKHRMVACVTFWDRLPAESDPVATFRKLCEEFESRFGIEHVLCITPATSAQTVCDAIHGIASRMRAESIVVDEEAFKFRFNILPEASEAALDMKSTLDAFDAEVAACLDVMRCGLPTDDDRDVVAHALVRHMRERTDAVADEFVSRHSSTFVRHECYVHHARIWAALRERLDVVEAEARAMLSFDIRNPNDIRNLIRKCPHCGLIWWKVYGCDGKTSCGNRPKDAPHDHDRSFVARFVFTLVAGKLVYRKTYATTRPPVSSSSSSSSPSSSSSSSQPCAGAVALSPAGCGRDFVWKDTDILARSEIDRIMRVLGMSYDDFKPSKVDEQGRRELMQLLYQAQCNPEAFFRNGASQPQKQQQDRRSEGDSELDALLGRLALGQYVAAFRAAGVRMEDARGFSRNDLAELGLTLKERVALYNALHPEDKTK
jgi:hypothetical protein